MFQKRIFVSSLTALALAVAGAALAEQPATPFVSGDVNPVDEGDVAQIKAPDPSAKAQAKTEKMLEKEAGEISEDVNPVDEGDAAQIKAPDPSAKAQEKTEKMLKEEAGEIKGQ